MSENAPCPTSPYIRTLSNWISSGFGSGYARVAPGTVGTIVAFLFVALLWWFEIVTTTEHLIALAVATTVVGGLAVQISIKGSTEADPGWIVIDEWAGLYVALIGCSASSPLMLLAVLCTFRLLDILKPGPVGWSEKIPGSVGIMADDIVAGALSALIVQASWYLYGVALA